MKQDYYIRIDTEKIRNLEFVREDLRALILRKE